MTNRAERFAGAFVEHPGVIHETSAPAPGFDQVERTGDVPEELASERAVAVEAERLTRERFPHAAPGYIDPRIRDAVRKRLLREEAG